VSPTILRLALLHELAHIRRGDLWLGLIPYTAQLLFWWFPLTWIARREWEQAREEACDDAAVTWGKRPALLYGKLLVQLATGQRFPAVNVAGLAAPGCSPLKRRLVALRRGPIILTRAQRALLAMLVLGAICAFLPFRVRATVPFPEPLALLTDRNLPQYTVVPLGTLGGEYSDAYAINDSGQAVGTMSLPEGRGHAFVATDAETRDLSADSGFPRSMAFGINTQGSVAGTAFYRSEKPNAFFWDGKRHYIGTLPGFGYSQATGVNDSGAVVGTALRFRQKWGAVQAHAWVWQNGVIQDIGTLGGEYSHAVAIDNQGRIVGKADLPRTGSEGMTHAFVWERSSGMRDLGTLPGGKNSRAQGINDGGEVVGVSEGGDGTHQAFIVTGDTVMAPLPTLPGASEAVAQSINASGQVVGNVAMGNNDAHAVLWQRSVGEKGGQVFDLNACIPAASGWHLHCARGINNRGEIVGQGDWNGKQLAFLLRPVR
jgi:probable HAF family extracellular repeat protein